MGWFLAQSDFQSENACDLGKLLEGRISPAVLDLGQSPQSDPSQLRQITLAKPDKQFKRAQDMKVLHTVRLDNDSYVRIRTLQTRQEIVTGIASVVFPNPGGPH